MGVCPECGAALDSEEASFCSECGRPVREAPAGGAGDEEATRPVRTLASGQVAATPASGPASDSETREEFVDEVRKALADGVLDEKDGQVLEDTRTRLHLTAEEAEDLKERALGDVATEMTAGPGAAGAGAGCVLLEINPNQFYMAPYAAVLDFRVANRTDADLYDVKLSVRAKLLGEIDELAVELPPGLPQGVRLQIVPEKAGVHVLDIVLSYLQGRRREVWTAQAMLNVLAEPKVPSKVVFDQSIHAGDSAKIGFGFLLRNELPVNVGDALVFDVNEMITRELPPRWLGVHLRRVGGAARGRVRVVPELAERRVAMPTAGLFWPDGDDGRRVLLLGHSKVRMGRDRDSAVVLRLFPRNATNDNLSKQISRPHLLLSLRKEGLFLADRDTDNGTTVNGEDLRGEVPLPLGRPTDVHVGRALKLRFVPFLEDEGEKDLRVERYEALGHPDPLWRMAEGHRLRSVRIERIDNLARQEQYLVVYRWANCGRRIDCELSMPAAPGQSRLVRLGGQFWLEGLEAEQPVRVDDVAVGPGFAAPLSVGARLRSGGCELEVGEFRQTGL